MNLLDFFDTDLPIGRQSFFLRTLFLLSVLAGLFFFVTGETFSRLENTPQSVVLVLFGLVVSLFYGTAIVKRASDYDSSGIVPLLTFVAFVGFVAMVRFVPGFSDTVRAEHSLAAFAGVIGLQNLYLTLKSDGYS